MSEDDAVSAIRNLETRGVPVRLPLDHPVRLNTIAQIDRCVVAGDIDAAVAFAKELAYIDGSNENTVGMTALIQLVASMERVTRGPRR